MEKHKAINQKGSNGEISPVRKKLEKKNKTNLVYHKNEKKRRIFESSK